MTRFEPGDVVLIPFPFTDFSTLKQRPAVILSSVDFNHAREDIIVAAITSHVSGKADVDAFVLTDRERIAAGLPKPSMIRTGKIVTIDQRLVRKTLGRLPKATIKRLRIAVHSIL